MTRTGQTSTKDEYIDQQSVKCHTDESCRARTACCDKKALGMNGGDGEIYLYIMHHNA